MSKDTIYREDAIKALRLEYPTMPMFKSLREEWTIKTEGFRKAEEVIMQLPSADRPQAPLEHGYMWICPHCGLDVHSDFDRCVRCGYDRVDKPQGKWIIHEGHTEGLDFFPTTIECDQCGLEISTYWQYELSNYCPNCGAQMKGAVNESTD